MNKAKMIYKEIHERMTEKWFLKQMGMSAEQMNEMLGRGHLTDVAEVIAGSIDDMGRFSAKKTAEVAEPLLERLAGSGDSAAAAEGSGQTVSRLQAAYNYVLGNLFPEKLDANGPTCSIFDRDSSRRSLFLLQLLQAVFSCEEYTSAFDPTVDIHFLGIDEIKAKGYNREYLRLRELAAKNYIYEFMRIGVEMTPYNTLGHIAGVHYVAMHAARQLEELKVPVDLGLVSGAAAGHDIGKYGCKKSEERRIPYLHYYYTDICFNRFNMPMIGHIAANHSTWDLELENLSVESLLLIYADFRVKSSRNSQGDEIVHFYTLDDAFQVILDKLDNVDEAKEHRYRRVYNKLKDFEDYMISLGVDTNLPQVPVKEPDKVMPTHKKDVVLASANQIAKEYKYAAIDHNIRLMNKFNCEEDFGSLLETARSEKQWKSLRTYVSILGEYSTYMTEKQKLMTLKFLMELLLHKESDIRSQTGEIIGQIIARFNEEYKKELPAGVHLPSKDVTNISLWE